MITRAGWTDSQADSAWIFNCVLLTGPKLFCASPSLDQLALVTSHAYETSRARLLPFIILEKELNKKTSNYGWGGAGKTNKATPPTPGPSARACGKVWVDGIMDNNILTRGLLILCWVQSSCFAVFSGANGEEIKHFCNINEGRHLRFPLKSPSDS